MAETHETHETHETQQTIATWADETFGPVQHWPTAVERAGQEMLEFLLLATKNPLEPQTLIPECADIVITLYRLAAVLQVDLHEQIDLKMSINRRRQWVSYGTGHGHHLEGC